MGEQQIINDILEEVYGYGIHSDSDPEVKKEKEEKYNELVKQINTICTFVEKELKNVLGKDVGDLRNGIRSQVLRSIEAEIANGNRIMDSNGKIKSGKIFDIVNQSREEVLENATQNMSDEKRKNDSFTNDSENRNEEKTEYKDVIKGLEDYGLELSEDEKDYISISMQRVECFIKALDEKIASGLSEDEAVSLLTETMSDEEYSDLLNHLHTVGQVKALMLANNLKKVMDKKANTETTITDTEGNDEIKKVKREEESSTVIYADIQKNVEEMERLDIVIKKVGNIERFKGRKKDYVLVKDPHAQGVKYGPVEKSIKKREDAVVDKGNIEHVEPSAGDRGVDFSQSKHPPYLCKKLGGEIQKFVDSCRRDDERFGEQISINTIEGETYSELINDNGLVFWGNEQEKIFGLMERFSSTSAYMIYDDDRARTETGSYGNNLDEVLTKTPTLDGEERKISEDAAEKKKTQGPNGVVSKEEPVTDKEFDSEYEMSEDEVRISNNEPVRPKMEEIYVFNTAQPVIQSQIEERKDLESLFPAMSAKYVIKPEKEGLSAGTMKSLYGQIGSLKDTEESATTIGSLNGSKEERTEGDKTPTTPSDEEKE